MNFSLSIDTRSIEGLAEAKFNELRQPVQAAMAERFFDITRSNFGATGVDRPTEWPALSPRYAKRVDRDYATLFVSGVLESSVQWASSPSEAIVWTDNEYAPAHQWGDGHIPARPFMPIYRTGDLTPFAQAECVQAAQDEINRLLN